MILELFNKLAIGIVSASIAAVPATATTHPIGAENGTAGTQFSALESSDTLSKTELDSSFNPDIIDIQIGDSNMSKESATLALNSQYDRIIFGDEILSRYLDDIGSFTYDYETATVIVGLKSNSEAEATIATIFENSPLPELDISLEFKEEALSLNQLEQLAAKVEEENSLVLEEIDADVSYSTENGSLLIFVPGDVTTHELDASLSSVSGLHVQGAPPHRLNSSPGPEALGSDVTSVPVLVEVEDPNFKTSEACSSRTACGKPLRGGIGLRFQNESTYECSSAMTARSADGTRWLLTAGHCGSVNSRWAHGEQNLGPIRQTHNGPSSGGTFADVDVARIRIDNSYWLTSTTWGHYYNASGNHLGSINAILSNRASLPVNSVICLSSLHSPQSGGCGKVTSNSPGRLIEVSYDACPGDSGGLWYFASNGRVIAGGIHRGGPRTCHQSSGYSTVSPMPSVSSFFSSTIDIPFYFNIR